MKEAAQNQSAPGAFLAAGAGLGLGMGAGVPLGQQMAQSIQPGTTLSAGANSSSPDDPLTKLAYLKKLLEQGILTQEEYNAKRAAIIDKL